MLANSIISHLPVYAHNMVTSGEWKGGSICRMDSVLQKPGASDIALNYHLLKPIVEHSPDRVFCLHLICFPPMCCLFREGDNIPFSGAQLYKPQARFQAASS